MLLNKSACRQYARTNGKRLGGKFFDALERHVERKLKQACEAHNGSKKTLDIDVALYVGLLKE